jgi:hypothetical protein
MVDRGLLYVQLRQVADLIVGASVKYPTGQILRAPMRKLGQVGREAGRPTLEQALSETVCWKDGS